MEFRDHEREGKDEKMLAPDLKRNTKWRFLARSNVKKYYFKRALQLHGVCGGKLRKALFTLYVAMIPFCLKEGKA